MSYICKEKLIETIRFKYCLRNCDHVQVSECSDGSTISNCGIRIAIEAIRETEPDEVDEVKHGEWTESLDNFGEGICVACSGCGWIMPMVDRLTDRIVSTYKYCPHCGALME